MPMTVAKIDNVVENIKRFMVKAKPARNQVMEDSLTQGKVKKSRAVAALKRASMELSRSLTELRAKGE